MTASSTTRAERRLLRRLHSEAFGRLAAGDERFFDRHPARRNRIRLAGRAEIETVSAKDIMAVFEAVPGVRIGAAVRRIVPGATVKLLFPTHEREDVDVSELEAAAVFDCLAALVSDGVRIVSADLMEHVAKMGSPS